MNMLSATEVRKNWSMTLDAVMHERPVYIKRTHDRLAILNLATLNDVLHSYRFTANRFQEDDGSITLSLEEIDLVANGKNESEAKDSLAEDIKEYAEDFYREFAYWSAAPNRKSHIPYVLKALTLDAKSISEEIICRNGES